MEQYGQVALTELLQSQKKGSPSASHPAAGNAFPGSKRSTSPFQELLPQHAHRWTCDEAVTAVAYHEKFLFVGTVSGTLISYDLQTYQEVKRQAAHTGSILTLLSQDGLLFTGSSDSLVKVWNPGPQLEFKYTVYVLTDIGDIFSLAYLSSTSTLYMGTQNASIHWVRLDEETLRSQYTTHIHKMPAVRPSRFFDSTGPGGQLAPQQHETRKRISSPEAEEVAEAVKDLVEVPRDNQVAFAHHGAVYAMVIDPARNILATGSGDGRLRIWCLNNRPGRPIDKQILEVGDSILSMSLASSWQLCCGLDDKGILIVDLETLQVLRHDIAHGEGPLLALAAVEDGIFASSDDSVLAFDATTAEVSKWKSTGLVTAIATLPRNVSTGQLVTAGSDGSVILWNIALYSEEEEEDDQQANGSGLLLRYRTLKTDPLGNDSMINFLAKIVKYQTVSGRDRQHWSESRRCATAIRDQMRLMGASSDLIRVEDGNPIVFGEFKASSAITSGSRIMFYGHYDVIEASRDDVKWNTPPFQLTSINGYMYGRGVTDDKGPCAAALFAVAKLYAEKRLSSDVVFLIEGEEESGSFGFTEAVEAQRSKIGDVDWIIFSNSLWLDDHQPCLNYGLRGIIFLEIEVTSNKGDVHSGVDGGLFREPAKDMINLLSKITSDDEGKVTIPGFFDSVMPLTPNEERLYDDIVANTSLSREDLMHKWRYPSLTIHKFEVSGPHNQTVIPANVKAYISLRMVPSQTAEEITTKFRNHLNSEFSKFNSMNQLQIRVKYEADPWLGDPQNRLFTLMRDAVEHVWGTPPLYIREGGSIPVARALEKMFLAPAAQLPCGQSSDGAHLNNERMRTTNIFNARRVFEEVFANLGLTEKSNTY